MSDTPGGTESGQETSFEDWPLPPYAHIPGRTARHPEGFLDHVIDAAPSVTDEAGAARNAAFRFGLRLFSTGHDWEAHEVWEAVWLRAAPNGRPRHLVRGLIQLANARLKARMGRPSASARLLALADTSISWAFEGGAPTVMGLSRADVAAMRAAAQTVSSERSSVRST